MERGCGARACLIPARLGTKESRLTMNSGMTRRLALCAVLLAAACGGKEKSESEGAAAAPSAAPSVAATGKVITIYTITDETGNRFVPSEIEAHRGDVLHFVDSIGVHNVHFLADSNPGIPNLPAASEMLQIAGQTLDITVDFPAGKTLYFQCDPHAALGMKGHLKVEE